MKDYLTEIRKSESRIPAIPNTVRDSVHENSPENIPPDETAALETPEENGQNTPYTPGSCKSTRKNFGKPASSFSDFYM